MSFNAVTSIVLDSASGLLKAKGLSEPENGSGAEIYLAVSPVSDPDQRRCQGIVPEEEVEGPSWTGEIPNEADPPYSGGEEVYVTGVAHSDSRPRELWVNKLTIGDKLG
jgi:hypothetical protein